MTRESILKRLDKLKERKKNNPNYPQAAIDKELKFWQGQLKKLPTSLANIKFNKPDDFAKDIVKKKSPVKPQSDVIKSNKKMTDELQRQKKVKENKKFRAAYLGTNTSSKPKNKKLVDKKKVSPKPPVIKSNKKMTDELQRQKKVKENKKFRAAYLGTNQSSEPKIKPYVKPKPPVIKSNKKMTDELRRQKKAKENKNLNKGPDKTKKSSVESKARETRSFNKIKGPDKTKKLPVKIKAKTGPARTVAEAQRRNLDTFTNKKGKVLAAITKEQLAKTGKGLTPLLNAQKKSGKSLFKYLESEGIIKKGKPTTKKMGGGKVFRRGGGQALRGFGKATYSNKMY